MAWAESLRALLKLRNVFFTISLQLPELLNSSIAQWLLLGTSLIEQWMCNYLPEELIPTSPPLKPQIGVLSNQARYRLSQNCLVYGIKRKTPQGVFMDRSLRCPTMKRKNRGKIFNSIFFRGARLLQMLPTSQLEAPNVNSFRKSLKRIDLLSALHLVDIFQAQYCTFSCLSF